MSCCFLLFKSFLKGKAMPSRQHQAADIVPMEPGFGRSAAPASAAFTNIVDLRVDPCVFGADFGIDTLAVFGFRSGHTCGYSRRVRGSQAVGAGGRNMRLIGGDPGRTP